MWLRRFLTTVDFKDSYNLQFPGHPVLSTCMSAKLGDLVGAHWQMIFDI
jgi:hypothetical protein